MTITFICTGNTCRSPLAEGLFKKSNISCEVYSAGLACPFGERVSENSLITARDYGVDISSHTSQPLTKELLYKTDLFVCLNESHAMQIAPVVGKNRIYVLGNGIPDPFGKSLETYKRCAKEILLGIDKLNEDLKKIPITSFMKKEDVSAVAEIENKCFSTPWSEKSLLEEIENPNSRFMVSSIGDEILGYVGTICVAGECSVTNIAVKEKYRNRGIASALLQRAVFNSLLCEDEFITLEVRKSNLSAIRLYEKFGFEKVGERKNFYRLPPEDAYIFNKYLKGLKK